MVCPWQVWPGVGPGCGCACPQHRPPSPGASSALHKAEGSWAVARAGLSGRGRKKFRENKVTQKCSLSSRGETTRARENSRQRAGILNIGDPWPCSFTGQTHSFKGSLAGAEALWGLLHRWSLNATSQPSLPQNTPCFASSPAEASFWESPWPQSQEWKHLEIFPPWVLKRSGELPP